MAPPLGAPPAWDPRRGSLAGVLRAGGPAVAQAGVLGGSRVQLENGLARTKAKADLGAGDAAPLYPGFIPGGSDDLRWATREKPHLRRARLTSGERLGGGRAVLGGPAPPPGPAGMGMVGGDRHRHPHVHAPLRSNDWGGARGRSGDAANAVRAESHGASP